MPRYVVERVFPEGLGIEVDPAGAQRCRELVARNAYGAVTGLHSYVSVDEQTTFCVCEAPSPEAIRKVAAWNRLPVDRITQVRVLDPYFDG